MFPELSTPFTATFVRSSPKSAGTSAAPKFSSDTLAALGIPLDRKFKPGDELVTISSDGDHTLYILRSDDSVKKAVLFGADSTVSYNAQSREGARMAARHLPSLDFKVPVLPYTLPSTVPPALPRSERNELDELLELPKSARLLKVLYPSAKSPDGGPFYADGYTVSSSQGWSDVVTGSNQRPNYRVRFSGRERVTALEMPRSVEIVSENATSTSGKVETQKSKYEFLLVGLKEEALPEASFDVESLVGEGSFISNDKNGGVFREGKGSISEQLKAQQPSEKPRAAASSTAMVLALAIGVVLVAFGFFWSRRKE